ncbi:hypothetical protein L218DRAFT_1077773 [Marasmius fiardii PR-910]|nr:hypothetical protein L218DRAFT_1077773 [Marasmius fiardii PR-910]
MYPNDATMTVNEITSDNLEFFTKETDNGALDYERHTFWKRYSSNPTLASIQRAIESSKGVAGVDERPGTEGWTGIPVECLQVMDEHLREAWRQLALDDLPTRPSSSKSTNSDDSTPPATPTEGRSPVMHSACMADKPLFNPFPDEKDYVEFMLKTASTMAVGAFDPFDDEPHALDIVIPIPTFSSFETDAESIFHLPSDLDETEMPHTDALVLTEDEGQSFTETPSNFKDLDRLGRRIPQAVLDRRRRRQRQRCSAEKCESNVPVPPEKPITSRWPQYMCSSSDILCPSKIGHIQRHPDERQLLRLLSVD